MKLIKDLVDFLFQISIVGIGNMKLLKEYYVNSDVKWSATHCKGSQKIMFGTNIKMSSLKVHNLVGNLMPKLHANWVSSRHPFDDVSRVKVCFNSP